MKTFRSLRLLVLAAAVFLSAGQAVQAQNMNTNDIPIPWTTITAGVGSNTTSFGNSGGYTPGASVRIKPSALGATFTWSFTCATTTLAAASIVLQGSIDNSTWHNVPASTGGSGVLTILVPASAASANNTNVVFSTNVSQAYLGGYNWWRVAGSTNGNAASLTSSRLQVGSW